MDWHNEICASLRATIREKDRQIEELQRTITELRPASEQYGPSRAGGSESEANGEQKETLNLNPRLERHSEGC